MVLGDGCVVCLVFSIREFRFGIFFFRGLFFVGFIGVDCIYMCLR